MDWNREYLHYRDLMKGRRLPAALVDLDRFDANAAYVAATQQESHKTIRVAGKSIRCVDLLKRVFEVGGPAFRGVLAFTVEEAAFLLERGLDDIIVAYPTVQPSDLDLAAEKTSRGGRLTLMADCFEHLAALSEAGRAAGVRISACLDIDMSYRLVRGRVHLGVRRSPLRTEQEAVALARRAAGLAGVEITAVMGYEAQIASVNDDLPGRVVRNRLIRLVKKHSVRELARRRGRVVTALRAAGLDIQVVNGGGSGSLASTARDESVTEVTAGSAFFAPGLFRHFHEVSFKPAAFFALQVVRRPAPGLVTCQGGGYVASGTAGRDKLPIPVMPAGLSLLSLEGAGEVQTPLALPKDGPELNPGDPVFFQHAKAGELCERFNELLLVQGGRVIGSALTYRGQGRAFL